MKKLAYCLGRETGQLVVGGVLQDSYAQKHLQLFQFFNVENYNLKDRKFKKTQPQFDYLFPDLRFFTQSSIMHISCMTV